MQKSFNFDLFSLYLKHYCFSVLNHRYEITYETQNSAILLPRMDKTDAHV